MPDLVDDNQGFLNNPLNLQQVDNVDKYLGKIHLLKAEFGEKIDIYNGKKIDKKTAGAVQSGRGTVDL